MSDAPIFITSFNRLSPLRLLVEWLEVTGHDRIVIVDNASSYPPLLDYLAETPHRVVRLTENLGHRAVWDAGIVGTLAPGEHYVVTDPDVVPDPRCPADALDRFRELLGRYPGNQKAGFGLRIDDLPEHYAHRDEVIRWETQFWQRRLERGVYQARVDTTFALYRPWSPSYVHTSGQSIRTGFPYVARHLPWYADSANPTAEDEYYRASCRPDVTNWGREEISETKQASLAELPAWTVGDRVRWRLHVLRGGPRRER